MKTVKLVATSIVAMTVGALISAAQAQSTFIPLGSEWNYLDAGQDPGASWAQAQYDDSAWESGPAVLGYGDSQTTVVDYVTDTNGKNITTYFRHAFDVTDASTVAGLKLEIQRDDGAVVYLNGDEIFRTNMPDDKPVTSSLQASSAISGSGETALISSFIDPASLVSGPNLLAVEIHQSGGSSSDISFDLRLSESTPGLVRGPYLQRASASQVTVRWRTTHVTDAVIRYGLDENNLNLTVEDTTQSTDHSITISGLNADTVYYYAVADSVTTYAQGPDFYFVTHPSPGTARDTRIWVLGDSGTADANAAAVRNAFLDFNGGSHADVWLMLGDNAYNDGTDSEYQRAVFDMYPTVLRNSVLWPTLGNHDGQFADSATQSGPYYDIFTLPTSGESGGYSSRTEAYYSFDYANIHFICLDSHDTDRSTVGDMVIWAKNDLMNTSQEWIIAFWHHPPYSKGSHDSDDLENPGTEFRLVEMRENFVPLFESYGVDLVLGGHSHSYERSMLIDGHTGQSSTFDDSINIIDGGDGDPGPGGDGEYVKQPQPNDGAVYAVAGSSGKIENAPLNHPVMITNLIELGSLVIDVFANQMDVRFINDAGVVRDAFRIRHDPGSTTPPAAPSDLVATADAVEPTIILTWADNATDEDYQLIERSPDGNTWAALTTVNANVESYSDTSLNFDTPYHYRIQAASNSNGASAYSNPAMATTAPAPPFIDQVADGETISLGTVTGSFSDTHNDDGAVQSITETESGGKPSNRHSQLQHAWNFTVASGEAITLYANVWSSDSAFDDFLFEASNDGGASWTELFSVRSTNPTNTEMKPIPFSGSVIVRVTDTDRSKGELTLDTIFVDELFIRTDTQPGIPPAAPSSLMASAKGSGEIQLNWTDNATDEMGFQIERRLSTGDWAFLANAAAGTATGSVNYSDMSVEPNTSYLYRVLAYSNTGTPSEYSNEASATTDPLPPTTLALSASGYKDKGKNVIELTWSGATSGNVDIYRGETLLKTIANEGAYTDNTGDKGGATYVYKVCEAGSNTACSNIVTVTF